MMTKIAAVLFAVLLAFALLLSVLYVELSLPGLMEKRFEMFAQAPGDYARLARDITGYLNGKDIALDYFQAHEQAHMKDVQALVGLLKQVLIALWASILLLAFFLRRRPIRKAAAITLLVALLLVLFAAIYAVVDFDGLFVLFHKIAFTNDLWLLNPYTDYLIQLMPIGFFMAYALSVGLIWGLLMVLCIFLQRRNHGLLFRFKKAN
jgi:integral membrane protein TIGR01906